MYTGYTIFQLPLSNEKLFRRYSDDLKVDFKDYVGVWQGSLARLLDYEDKDACEIIFSIFNSECPKGFAGHSMSVSDLIEIRRDGNSKYYYCDSVGFKDVTEAIDASLGRKIK